jgi:hypothetical protein
MMESNQPTPLPLTENKNTNNNGGISTSTNEKSSSSSSVESVLATSLVKRALAFRPTNPLPGVTNFKTFGQLLKKEAPKIFDIRGYSKPTSAEQAFSRIRANVSFFRVTYTAVFSTVVLLFILSNPTLFIFTILLAALWTAFLSQPPEHVLKVGNVELKRNEKTLILASLTVIVVVFGGLISSALYIIFMSGLIIGSHGAFREPIVLDALEQLEQEGESIVQGDVV